MSYEIGKLYRVPCVWIDEFHGARNVWIPIIGPLHEDREHINFPPRHWHIDWRFAQARLMVGYMNVYGVVVCKDLWGVRFAVVLKGPELKRRKMLREWPPYPMAAARKAWLNKLEAAYAGHRLKGMVCPHRGLPLEGCPREGDVVTCHGHGLRWNVKTGELVREELRLNGGNVMLPDNLTLRDYPAT